MLSFEEIQGLVRKALNEGAAEGSHCYIVDQYPDSVVYEQSGKYFKRAYAIADDKVTLGEPTAVQKQVSYVPVPLQAAGEFLAAVGDPQSEDYGYTWRIQIVKYGPAKKRPINWPREPLAAAIPLYEGARVFCLNDTQHVTPKDRPCGKSAREIVGWVKNVADTGTALEADFEILHSAKWLRDTVVDAFNRGKPDLLGFSHDVDAVATTKMVAGRKVKEPVTITGVEIDVVYDPTNEGKFLRMAAAGHEDEENEMRNKLLAALQKTRPDLAAQVTDQTTDDQLVQMVAAAAVKAGGGDEGNEQLVAAVVKGLRETLAAQGTNEDVRTVKLVACGLQLRDELGQSKLPEPVQQKLRKQFEGKVFEVATLQAAIKTEKEVLDALTGSGLVAGAGDVRVGRDSTEKLQAAVDKLFGVQVSDNFKDIPGFRGLRAAYVEMTGDAEISGVLNPDQARRMQAAYGTTSFAYVLGNTLYRRMVQDYREIGDYGVSRLVGPNIRNAVDYRTMESVRVGYYGDLPDVNPETEDYPDLGEVGDEEISYALNGKGGNITVTRRMILNDDVRVLTKIVSRLPRASRRTKAKRAWSKFIGNATYKGDNKAVFHADHANLGSTAYGIASALAARNALMKATEPGSGERINLRPVTVAFPTELFGIVKNVNEFQPQAVTVDNGNSMYGYFKPDGLVEVPFMTDATDWMMFADPYEVDILEMAFLNGQQEPQMLVADNPTVGQMFVADKMQYRIRDEYEVEIIDYRGCYKAVVAG